MEKTKTKKLKHTCDQCEKSFCQAFELKRHQSTHTDERPHVCEICEKRFREKNSLDLHWRNHTGERPYKCSHCNKDFTRSSYLKVHLRTHTGEKPYICDVCEATFRDGSALRMHKRRHTGEAPYECTCCGKRFARNYSLHSHMRTHSGDKPYREKVFSCEQCSKTFYMKSHLTVHLRVHTGEKPYACPECRKRFARNGSLTRHMITHDKKPNPLFDGESQNFAGQESGNEGLTESNDFHEPDQTLAQIKTPEGDFCAEYCPRVYNSVGNDHLYREKLNRKIGNLDNMKLPCVIADNTVSDKTENSVGQSKIVYTNLTKCYDVIDSSNSNQLHVHKACTVHEKVSTDISYGSVTEDKSCILDKKVSTDHADISHDSVRVDGSDKERTALNLKQDVSDFPASENQEGASDSLLIRPKYERESIDPNQLHQWMVVNTAVKPEPSWC